MKQISQGFGNESAYPHTADSLEDARAKFADLLHLAADELSILTVSQLGKIEDNGLLYADIFRKLQLKPESYQRFFKQCVLVVRRQHIDDLKRNTRASIRHLSSKLLRTYGPDIWLNREPHLLPLADLDGDEEALVYHRMHDKNAEKWLEDNTRFFAILQHLWMAMRNVAFVQKPPGVPGKNPVGRPRKVFRRGRKVSARPSTESQTAYSEITNSTDDGVPEMNGSSKAESEVANGADDSYAKMEGVENTTCEGPKTPIPTSDDFKTPLSTPTRLPRSTHPDPQTPTQRARLRRPPVTGGALPFAAHTAPQAQPSGFPEPVTPIRSLLQPPFAPTASVPLNLTQIDAHLSKAMQLLHILGRLSDLETVKQLFARKMRRLEQLNAPVPVAIRGTLASLTLSEMLWHPFPPAFSVDPSIPLGPAPQIIPQNSTQATFPAQATLLPETAPSSMIPTHIPIAISTPFLLPSQAPTSLPHAPITSSAKENFFNSINQQISVHVAQLKGYIFSYNWNDLVRFVSIDGLQFGWDVFQEDLNEAARNGVEGEGWKMKVGVVV